MLSLKFWSRLGYPFVSQNQKKFCASHFPGQILVYASTICIHIQLSSTICIHTYIYNYQVQSCIHTYIYNYQVQYVYIYNYQLHNSKWITFPFQSYMFLYSFWASLLHSLIRRFTVSSLSLHSIHLLFSWVLSSFYITSSYGIILCCYKYQFSFFI